MRFVTNTPRVPVRVLFSLLNGGRLFTGGFDRSETLTFRVTIGVKNRFGEPIWWYEWDGKVGEFLVDPNGKHGRKGPAEAHAHEDEVCP